MECAPEGGPGVHPATALRPGWAGTPCRRPQPARKLGGCATQPPLTPLLRTGVDVKASSFCRASLLSLLDRAGWRILRQGVLRRVCHDINGRICTLGGLARLVDSWGAAMASDLLREETGRLERTVELVGLLTDEPDGFQLLTPLDLLVPAARVVESQPGMEGARLQVEVDPQAPPVRGDRTLLVRGVGILLAGTARQVRRDADPVLRVAASGQEGALVVTVCGDRPESELLASGETSHRPAVWSARSGEKLCLERVREALRQQGVAVYRPKEGKREVRLYLRFPPPLASPSSPEGSGMAGEEEGSPKV